MQSCPVIARLICVSLTFLVAVGVARADEASSQRALAARFVAASDVVEQLRSGARTSLETAVARQIPEADGAERAAMVSQVEVILSPIVERRMPAIVEALDAALAAEFTAAELQQLIDMAALLKRADVAGAVAAARRATTAGDRVRLLSALPADDFERVLLFLGSPTARRLETTVRTTAQQLSRDMMGEALAALAQACAPSGMAAPRWCEATARQ